MLHSGKLVKRTRECSLNSSVMKCWQKSLQSKHQTSANIQTNRTFAAATKILMALFSVALTKYFMFTNSDWNTTAANYCFHQRLFSQFSFVIRVKQQRTVDWCWSTNNFSSGYSYKYDLFREYREITPMCVKRIMSSWFGRKWNGKCCPTSSFHHKRAAWHHAGERGDLSGFKFDLSLQ